MQQSIQLDATLPDVPSPAIAEGVEDDENVEEMEFEAADGGGTECD